MRAVYVLIHGDLRNILVAAAGTAFSAAFLAGKGTSVQLFSSYTYTLLFRVSERLAGVRRVKKVS